MNLEHRKYLLETIAKDEDVATKDRLKAIDQLSKIEGDYIARSQVDVVAMPTVIQLVNASEYLRLKNENDGA